MFERPYLIIQEVCFGLMCFIPLYIYIYVFKYSVISWNFIWNLRSLPWILIPERRTLGQETKYWLKSIRLFPIPKLFNDNTTPVSNDKNQNSVVDILQELIYICVFSLGHTTQILYMSPGKYLVLLNITTNGWLELLLLSNHSEWILQRMRK